MEYESLRRDIDEVFHRRGVLVNYIPWGLKDLLKVVDYTTQEALLQGRKLIILSPRFFQREIRERAAERAAQEDRSTVILPSRRLPCSAIGGEIRIADVVNHCFGGWKCPYQKGFDLSIFREILSGERDLWSSRRLLEEAGMCPSRLVVDLAAEAAVVVTDYPFVFHQGFRRLLSDIAQDPRRTVLLMVEPYYLLSEVDEEYTYTITEESLKGEWLGEIGRLPGVLEEDLRILEAIKEGLLEIIDDRRRMVKESQLFGNEESEVAKRERKPQNPRVIKRHEIIAKLTERVDIAPEEVVRVLRRLLDLKFERPEIRWRYANLYLFVKFSVEQYGSVLRYYFQEGGEEGIRVSVLHPGDVIRDVIDEVWGVIITATGSYPTSAYTDLMGLGTGDYTLKVYFDSSEYEDTVRVFIHDGIYFPKPWREPGKLEEAIVKSAEFLESFIKYTSDVGGRYAVVFPSFRRKDEILGLISPPAGVVQISDIREKPDGWWESTEEKMEKENWILYLVGNSSLWNHIIGKEISLRGVLLFDVPHKGNWMVVEERKKLMRSRYGRVKGTFLGEYLHPFYLINSMISHNLLHKKKAFMVLVDRRYSSTGIRAGLPSFIRSVTTKNPIPMIDDFFSQ
ncbi:MAG: hypothetical protein J7L88_06405 [Thermoplasmata archaeon]|nr:hypothetical protein [Thermoplasmata archaeon]